MAENSSIEWTDHTFNPWRGCAKVAAGCANCYAARMAKRNPGTLGVWGDSGTRVVAAEKQWRLPLKWSRSATEREVFRLGMPETIRWRESRPRVFCASLADVFEDWRGPVVDSQGRVQVTINGAEWFSEAEYPECRPLELRDVRRRMFDLIDRTTSLDWLLLTKRPENILFMWPARGRHYSPWHNRHYRPNVWLGTSVACRDDLPNVNHLRLCGDLAPVLFLSIEPLIEDLGTIDLSGINWVIVGGESGPHARPMRPAWVRSIRDQCNAANVPFFFKQWGEYIEPDQMPDDLFTAIDAEHNLAGAGSVPFRVGKAAAGRLLDGREWNGLPEVHHET